MSMQVAMLRADRTGNINQEAMCTLCRVLADLGFTEIRSLLQSGNLVFRGEGPSGQALEQLLESGIRDRLGARVTLFSRTAEEWRAVVAQNPFREEVVQEPGHVMMMFLKQAPAESRLEALRLASIGPERCAADGRQLYVLHPNGVAGSHLTRTLIEHQLGTPVTSRSWHTILQVRRLMHDLAADEPRCDATPLLPPTWIS